MRIDSKRDSPKTEQKLNPKLEMFCWDVTLHGSCSSPHLPMVAFLGRTEETDSPFARLPDGLDQIHLEIYVIYEKKYDNIQNISVCGTTPVSFSKRLEFILDNDQSSNAQARSVIAEKAPEGSSPWQVST